MLIITRILNAVAQWLTNLSYLVKSSCVT